MALGEGLLRLIRETLRFRGRLFIAAAALVTLAATRLYLTWLVKLWMEADSIPEGGPTLTFLLITATITTLLMVLAIMVSEYLVSDVNQRMLQGLRQQAQHKLLTMGVAGVWRFHSGELLSRLFSDVGLLSGFVRRILTDLVGETLLAVGAISMMFYLNWRLALGICLVVPIVGLTLNRLSGTIRTWAGTAQSGLAVLNATFTEQLRGITTIKGYQAEHFEHRRFVEQDTAYRCQFMRCELWTTTLISIIWLVTTIGFIGIVWYGSRQVAEGNINLGALLAFCLYAAQTIEPIRKLSNVTAALQRCVAAASRVFEVIDSDVVEHEGSIVLNHPVQGTVQFENVEFSYRTGEPVLKGIDLTLRPGERAAVVAASGGGKTTLAKLLMRFCDAQQGRILLDGIDIRALRLLELRRVVCVVEQEPFIFGGPLIDNIRYGSWDAPLKEIEDAVHITGLKSLVRSLPHGLSTELHEGGRDLSGGQKQRIALARAVVRDPRVLILDEATSALDSDTERQILEQMENWMAGRTVLVMAHRLSTVLRAPRIIVLEGGQVAGGGTVNELLEYCTPFRQLFSEQLEPVALSLNRVIVAP
jgi:ATP-binding cassette, subfamily B, bacterial MsbA